MGTPLSPKPQSLRLPREVDAEVRVFARTLTRGGSTSRIPMNKALVVLVEAGLSTLHAGPSAQEGLRLALKELDPEWSGAPLADFEPIPVATRSGMTPVEILLDRRR